MERIHIVGCSKSGTTLLQRLFWSFKNAQVINSEITYITACSAKAPSECELLVSKRSHLTVFSNSIGESEIKRQLNAFKEADVKLLAITRERESCLNAKSGGPPPHRYDACIKQQAMYADEISHFVTFERLISEPNKVQEELAAKFNLEIEHLFTDYPDFVPESSFVDAWGPSYRARRLGDPV